MTVHEFIEKCESLGYECQIGQGGITINQHYGHDLEKIKTIGWVSLVASNNFKMNLDPQSERDGIGNVIIKFGQSSIRERGRLSRFHYKNN